MVLTGSATETFKTDLDWNSFDGPVDSRSELAGCPSTLTVLTGFKAVRPPWVTSTRAKNVGHLSVTTAWFGCCCLCCRCQQHLNERMTLVTQPIIKVTPKVTSPTNLKKRKQLKIGTKQTKQMDNVRYDALSLPSTAARLLGSLQSKMKLVDIKKK